MGLVPDTKQGKINFYQARIADWLAHAVAIGSSVSEITALQTKLNTAAAALIAQETADAVKKTATATADEALDVLSVAGANVIAQIRVAGRTGGQAVYDLAQIPAPAAPSPVGPPGLPYKLEVGLRPDGSVELKFKCDNPTNCNNVIYQVYRKIELTSEYSYIGGTGERKFVDVTVPRGVPSVIYQIQATRSTAVGVAAEFVVNFGAAGTGPTVTALSDGSTGKSAKVAA